MIKNLLTRTSTGIVYVLLIIVALYSYSWIFFGVFAAVMLLTLKEFVEIMALKNHTVNQGWAFVFALALFTVSCGNVCYDWNIPLSFIAVPIILALCTRQLFQKSKNPFESIVYTLFAVLYVAIPFCLLIHIVGGNITTLPVAQLHVAVIMFVFTWSNDTFAYLWGVSLGRHKLFPRISPKKSVEGFVGGLLTTLVLAYCISYWVETPLNNWQWVGAAVVIVRVRSSRALRITQANALLNEERYKTVVEQANDIVFEWNLQDGTMYYSSSWEEMYEQSNCTILKRRNRSITNIIKELETHKHTVQYVNFPDDY